MTLEIDPLEKEVPITKPSFSAETQQNILAGIQDIMIKGRLIHGPFEKSLEEFYADMTQCSDAVAIATCSSGLQMVMEWLDVRGKEVLVPAASFVTDVSMIIAAGGIPVLVDVNPKTLSFDLADLKRKKTLNTKAVIWVHLTGFITPEWKEIKNFCAENDLFLIEDAAHAHGASINGCAAGSLGDVGLFSFYATKVVAVGTGGIATTNIKELADYVRSAREFGKDLTSGETKRLGSDHLLDEIRSCVAFYQSKDLHRLSHQRRMLAALYDDKLSNAYGVYPIEVSENNIPSYYQYVVSLDDRIDTDRLLKDLKSKHKISCKKIYPPIYQEVVFRSLSGALPGTEKALHRSICLPIFPGLEVKNIDRVVNALTTEVRKQIG